MLASAIALLAAALMGLAIQRGATCMVAAVAELVEQHKAGRALALAEAALWVGGLVILARMAGWLPDVPAGHAASWQAFAGGVALGLGAWLNAACMFGTIARIGSGQWAWLATPIGYYLACLAVPNVPTGPADMPPALSSLLPLVIGFAALLSWRLVQAQRAPSVAAWLWHPHRATLLIAVTFVITMLTVGAWAYTDALTALARAMNAQLGLRGVMVMALLGGAIGGGWLARSLRPIPVRAIDLVRCLAGGGLMGVGAVLVPGGNDGLIMVGLPLLQAQAWVAVPAMAATIALAIWAAQQWPLANRVAKS
ncbi:YeeE/YedE thiosulfate transporter family protein [Sandarakinorhabdus rubra]|uniref:YeeE/YedE thiosulfate transporter family protein n=1 Tax=Sandarakinorhabdus rubra TaxID=2672568 RepID=UPI001F318004|nr:YeeE/YedE thiosulfate transporter family protein [Sandarakinorhabdus rubra]